MRRGACGDSRRLLRVAGVSVFATFAALWVAGCGSGSSGGSASPQVQVTDSGGGQVRLGSTDQFSASGTGVMNSTVTWEVNGVAGGSSALGTISSAGLYTPPASIPNPNTVTITAVSQAASGVSGSLMASILNPAPTVTSAVVTVNSGATTGLLDVVGAGFLSSTQLQVGGSGVSTTYVSPKELQATVTVPSGTTSLAISVVNPNPGGVTATANAQVTALKATLTAAARLLDQATFGPTLTDIQHVEAVGLQGYLNEQFAMTPTVEPDITNPPPTACATNVTPCQQSEWWQTAITAPDQLRQRVALALSEMFVISTNSVNARAVTTYQNMLVKDAFANFYTVMKDVTLSPGMGAYLNMLNSAKPGVVNGVPQIANENYARENMQLFTIGLEMLNQDGSPQLDGSANPIPTFTQDQVQAFARAYTGWTYASATGGTPTNFPNNAANYDAPMAAVESEHDTTAKALLNGTTLPAGQTAEQDLDGALTNLFNHQNVGPFVCKQLIQHLVASQPSPAYVSRVAVVFANDGTGTRGNMKAVIQAILMDSEARAADTSPSFDGGHLREPMLYLANVIRGLGFTNTDPNGFYYSLSNYTAPLSEKPYASGSVFNFFPPSYVIPGSTTNAPEFSIENTASAILRLTLADQLVNNKISSFSVDLSATSPLGIAASKTGNATTDSGTLVDMLGAIFLHGQMPAQERSDIVAHVATLTNTAQRVRVAAYLVITSSFYKVEH